MAKPIPKAGRVESKKITESARDEDCTLQIVGICSSDSSTVVFCHFPDETNGMGTKSDDVSGGYGCYACHQVVDGHRYWQEFVDNKDFYMRRSQTRTTRRLHQKGVVKVA